MSGSWCGALTHRASTTARSPACSTCPWWAKCPPNLSRWTADRLRGACRGGLWPGSARPSGSGFRSKEGAYEQGGRHGHRTRRRTRQATGPEAPGHP
ncbi:hypothetical protein [Streptomyces sp. NBC_00647]|uniref:hypothetical protein n=1 Tax=Streptomyces sp. NBC_00647 TaxID=2975796 RepID=UPI00386D8B5C